MGAQNFRDIRNSNNLDAFNRMRVSSPVAQFEYQNQYNAGPLIWNEKVGGAGASLHQPNTSTVLLSTGNGTAGSYIVRQTKKYFRYSPGKSLQAIVTFMFGSGLTNVRKRVGYFDDDNGIFIEQNGANVWLVKRSKVSGSVVETKVLQADWNIDSLIGQGIVDDGREAVNLDWTKSQIFFIDFQWLGVGTVRCGFEVDGLPIYVHQFDHANEIQSTYTTSANLPIRYEINNLANVATATSLVQICSSVVTEQGAVDDKSYYSATANNGVSAVSVTTRRAVLSLRAKATFNSIVNRGQIIPDELLVTAASQNVLWELVIGGALGGSPSWASVGDNSLVERDVAGTTVTGGTVLASGYSVAGSGTVRAAIGAAINDVIPLALDIDGANPNILSVVCTAFTGTATVTAALNWKEIY